MRKSIARMGVSEVHGHVRGRRALEREGDGVNEGVGNLVIINRR